MYYNAVNPRYNVISNNVISTAPPDNLDNEMIAIISKLCEFFVAALNLQCMPRLENIYKQILCRNQF